MSRLDEGWVKVVVWCSVWVSVVLDELCRAIFVLSELFCLDECWMNVV